MFQILFLSIWIRRTCGSESRQLPSLPDPFENGRMGIGQNKSFLEILSRRVPFEDVRGTAEENHYGSIVCSSMAR